MVPIFEIFGKQMSVYMLLALIGVLLVLFFGYKRAEKTALDEFKMLYVTLWAFVGTVIGGHILYGITQFSSIISFFKLLSAGEIDTFDNFMIGLQQVFGGSVFYGGLIGAMISAGIYAKVANLSSDYFDIGACMIPLFHTFGRVGCFLSGCCYGVESKIGFVYHYSPDSVANGVRRFPIQLVEALFNLILFIVIFYLLRKSKMKGKLFLLYLLFYSIIRFTLEFFRGDVIRGHLWIFSTSQWISILIFIPAVLLLILKFRQKQN